MHLGSCTVAIRITKKLGLYRVITAEVIRLAVTVIRPAVTGRRKLKKGFGGTTSPGDTVENLV